ncbi:MAG: hypothetical protein AUJ85_00625 [Elusimicrobia bacterium CG1_02_37_114]|nr:MAG: hypothetical protein AUJ85_00625 [Elusimicrobia bacterium CG1_02_37_114]PIV52987.1 MAG: hypothetical protein COS17_06200 [Elusimicrobia bacterium CG02_land_8_20_14_3_00_37_13]PIZ14326.1 MAG: hypothetical protein COY53_00435 [Elusimicrobia bacterium CG_4_10_14_0_8_um_filter_37_32]
MRTTTIRPIGPRNQVTLPAEIIKHFRIHPHDLVSFSITKEGLLMKPVVVLEKNEVWEEGELDAIEKIIDKQIKAGEYVEFSDMSKADSFLKKKIK